MDGEKEKEISLCIHHQERIPLKEGAIEKPLETREVKRENPLSKEDLMLLPKERRVSNILFLANNKIF